MNKLSKIFLIIIIVLTIALGAMTYLYFHVASLRDDLNNKLAYAGNWLYQVMVAIEDAGLEPKRQDDNTIVLVNRETPVERVDE